MNARLATSAGRWKTKQEVADLFGISTRTVERWTSSGLLTCMRAGNVVRYHTDYLDAGDVMRRSWMIDNG
jgi:excisionase family DNA binding protein